MQSSVKEPWRYWCSKDLPPKQQYDSWCAALNESHLEWALSKPSSHQFYGEIEMRDIGGIRLLHCKSDPCHGLRTKHEIGQSTEAYFGLLLIYEGNELVKCGDKDEYIDHYGCVLWDSTRPVEFELKSVLKKVTLMVPQDLLRARFPKVDHFVGEKIDMSCGLGAVTASHIISLGREINFIDNGRGASIVDLTLELIATCLEAKQHRPLTKARNDLLTDIKAYIESNLDDPNLGPDSIANKFYISNRYLHLLFEDDNISVSNWIMHKRLERCRRELVRNGQYKKNITEVSFQWGFNDSAHFCRVFKKFYGLSPRDYQKRHFN